jgi:hypothetical protein
MANSARRTARGDIEVVAWLDDDDPTAKDYPALDFVRYLHGPREIQSNLWNRCWAKATGDIAMLCADDVAFETSGWDERIDKAFDTWPDRLGMVYPKTGEKIQEATLLFVTRRWIEITGTFTPPYFRSWFADRWIWEVAEQVGRDLLMPSMVIRHRRPSLTKGALDQTYLDAIAFREQDDPETLYLSPPMLRERQEQAMRLCVEIAKTKAKHLVPA